MITGKSSRHKRNIPFGVIHKTRQIPQKEEFIKRTYVLLQSVPQRIIHRRLPTAIYCKQDYLVGVKHQRVVPCLITGWLCYIWRNTHTMGVYPRGEYPISHRKMPQRRLSQGRLSKSKLSQRRISQVLQETILKEAIF